MAGNTKKILSQDDVIAAAQQVRWYVMRVYKQEMRVEKEFREAGFEVFVPKAKVVKKLMRHGKFVPVVKEQLAMTGYVFVNSSRALIQQFKTGREYIRWAMQGDDGDRVLMCVKDNQMRDFISITNQYEDAVRFYTAEDLSGLKIGARVRIIDGHLSGVEGQLVSIRGKRDRRLIVVLDGIGGASVDLQPELVAVI